MQTKAGQRLQVGRDHRPAQSTDDGRHDLITLAEREGRIEKIFHQIRFTKFF